MERTARKPALANAPSPQSSPSGERLKCRTRRQLCALEHGLYTALMSHQHGPPAEIVITHPENLEVEISSGSMTRLAGVSELLTGSTGIHLAIATVPPGRCSTAHYHTNCESAIYVVSGVGQFLSGPELDNEQAISEGDFIFVPPEANHQPVNTSDTDDLVLIVARNAPVEIVVELENLGRKDC